MGGSGGNSGAGLNGALPPQPADQSPACEPSDAAEPDSPSPEAQAPAVVRFTAVVREVRGAWLLVEALPGETFVSPEEQIEVPLEEAADLPTLSPGDQVTITCASVVHDPSGTVRVEGVQEIARIA